MIWPCKLKLLGRSKNLQTLPARYSVQGYRSSAYLCLVVSFLAIMKPAAKGALILIGLNEYKISQGEIIATLLAAVFIFLGLSQLWLKGFIDIKDDTVECHLKTIFGPYSWKARFSEYIGLQVCSSSNHSGVYSQRIYHIKLKHRKLSRSIIIYNSWSTDHLDEDMMYYKKLLGVKQVN